MTIAVGATQQLSVTFTPDNTTDKDLTYTAKDASVASVSKDGLVKGVQAGKSTITVTPTASKALTQEIQVTVTA